MLLLLPLGKWRSLPCAQLACAAADSPTRLPGSQPYRNASCSPSCPSRSDGLFEVLSNQQAVEVALAAMQSAGGGKASGALGAGCTRTYQHMCEGGEAAGGSGDWLAVAVVERERVWVPMPSAQAARRHPGPPSLVYLGAEAAAQAAADALAAQALKAGTRDNVTAVVQAFEW